MFKWLDTDGQKYTNQVTLIDRDLRVEELPRLSKYEVAHRVLDRVVALLGAGKSAG